MHTARPHESTRERIHAQENAHTSIIMSACTRDRTHAQARACERTHERTTTCDAHSYTRTSACMPECAHPDARARTPAHAARTHKCSCRHVNTSIRALERTVQKHERIHKCTYKHTSARGTSAYTQSQLHLSAHARALACMHPLTCAHAHGRVLMQDSGILSS